VTVSQHSGVGNDPQLFATDLKDWLEAPERAFEGWLAERGFRPSTSVVYAAMWAKWLRWTGERSLPLPKWQAHHIGEFLDDGGLEKRHRYRYARLIERVFHHLQQLQAVSHNPASRAVKERLAEGDNDPTAFLTLDEINQVIAFLERVDVTGEALRPATWKAVRDAALVAVFLGAGLKVSEARAASLEMLHHGATHMVIPQPQPGKVRQVVVLPFATAVLERWMAMRAASDTPGPWLFPANSTGRAMHAASIYRRIEHCLNQVGILSGRRERASPQTLRNSHAALLIEQGVSSLDLVGQLGMRDVTSGWRLIQAYRDWEGRLAGRPPQRPSDL
jgi:site-specific recombinase XerD